MSALAYLDAGTGSMIVGAVAAAGASVAVAAKNFGYKLRRKGKAIEPVVDSATTENDAEIATMIHGTDSDLAK